MKLSYERKSVRMLSLVPLLLSGVLLTACSGGASPADSGSGSGASPTGAEDRQLAFAQCMREKGVPKFPDPDEDGNSIIGKDSGVDPDSSAFKKASEACKDLAPQGEGANAGEPLDPAKVARWAQCVRDNGVPAFADPQIDGDTMEIDLEAAGIDPESPELEEAMETCQDKDPGGKMKPGGAQ
ncbi:hypothetical protein [Streptomyces sp. NPDC059894]|uniref:hypothetical protein n=1 Tax=unclassified Streptomyces TaxID=2593676 RepID=UPI0036636AA5